jgi:hypothetical protein
VDVVRHETIRLRDEQGDTRAPWSRLRLACVFTLLNNLRASTADARLKYFTNVFGL